MAGWIKIPLGVEVGLGPGDFVLDGDPAPLLKKGQSPPPMLAHFYCGQTAGWIKMPLGMELGLSLGDFVFDMNPAPFSPKGAEPPIFGPCPLWPNGWADQDGAWYGGRPQPRRLCVRFGPSSRPAPQKGSGAPNFRPMSVVAKRL